LQSVWNGVEKGSECRKSSLKSSWLKTPTRGARQKGTASRLEKLRQSNPYPLSRYAYATALIRQTRYATLQFVKLMPAHAGPPVTHRYTLQTFTHYAHAMRHQHDTRLNKNTRHKPNTHHEPDTRHQRFTRHAYITSDAHTKRYAHSTRTPGHYARTARPSWRELRRGTSTHLSSQIRGEKVRRQ